MDYPKTSVLKEVNVSSSNSTEALVKTTSRPEEQLHFPVPDFFETFETLTIEKVLKRLNNYDSSFLQVDVVSGAEQISVKLLTNTSNEIIGRQIIFSLPGRLETPDKDKLLELAVGAGWSSMTISEQSFGFNSYTKFYLTRKFK